MKKLIGFMLAIVLIPIVAFAAEKEAPSAAIVETFLEKSGGIEAIKAVKTLSAVVHIDEYGYQYAIQLLSDGRFRIDEPDRSLVFDGKAYWASFYGLVGAPSADQMARLSLMDLRQLFFHGLIDADYQPIEVEGVGEQERYGKRYNVVERPKIEGAQRTYYFNAETGLLDQIIEVADDPEYHQVKNVYRFGGYEQVGDLTLHTTSESRCVTNGQMINPPTRFADIKLNQPIDESRFAKPEQTAPVATFENGRILGQVIGLSQRNSVITNITAADLDKIKPATGSIIQAKLNDQTFKLAYYADLRQAPDIAPGAYLATFADSPALWLVKAYQGFTSDVETETGDAVAIKLIDDNDSEDVTDEEK